MGNPHWESSPKCRRGTYFSLFWRQLSLEMITTLLNPPMIFWISQTQSSHRRRHHKRVTLSRVNGILNRDRSSIIVFKDFLCPWWHLLISWNIENKFTIMVSYMVTLKILKTSAGRDSWLCWLPCWLYWVRHKNLIRNKYISRICKSHALELMLFSKYAS